jgi:acyl-CoA thioester hydrolase
VPEVKFFHPTEVRYGDLDPQGHVNNARYLTYFEQARVLYMVELGLFSKDQSFSEIGVIVADIHITYHSPVYWGAIPVVGVKTTRVGNKSLTLEQSLTEGRNGPAYATGTVVLVAYDYRTHSTILVPQEWRTQIGRFEGLELS